MLFSLHIAQSTPYIGYCFLLLLGSLFCHVISNNKIIEDFSKGIILVFGVSVVYFASYMLSDFNTMSTHYQHSLTFTLLGNGSDLVSLDFGLDGTSLVFFVLSAVLCFMCIFYLSYERPEEYKDYAFNLITIELLLLIIFSSTDILIFYICFEAVLIPMFFLIGKQGSRERKIRATYLFFFYTLVTSLLVLIAILIIYNMTGTLSFHVLSYDEYLFTRTEIQYFLWFAFFLSFAAKIPMFPVHIWLPEAHVEAPTVGSVLLAGILLKLGVYGFLRVNLIIFPHASVFFGPIISYLAVFGIIYASIAAMAQKDFKRIIAYSSIAHMNLVVLGLFSFNALGLEGAIIQSISHGFVSGGLFFLVGTLYDRYHTRHVPYLVGMVNFMPLFSAFFFIFTLANIAIPGSSSFVGEFLLLVGAFKKSILCGIIASIGVIACGTYSLWLYNKIVFGQAHNLYSQERKDIDIVEIYCLIFFLQFIIILGVRPDLYILEFIETCCEESTEYLTYISYKYSGK